MPSTRRLPFHGIFAVLLALASFAQKSVAEERPNILFILTDDQRDNTFSGMGHPWIKTPHVDDLLKKSTRFSNAYIAEPICRPSRASLLLGCHERVHRIGFSSKRKLTRKQWQGSYPVMLKQAGYYTGLVGKWHIDQEKGLELEDLFDVFNGHNGHGPFLFPVKSDSGEKTKVTTNQKKTDDAFAFIDNAPKDKPFCLSLCYATPHSSKFRLMWKQFAEPSFHNPDLADHPLFGKAGPYRDLEIKTPLDANPNPYDHIPRSVIDHDKGRNKTYNFCYDTEMCYELHMRYHQMVTEIDQMMGEIVAGLEKRNLTGKTLIIFGSDHGLLMGDYGMGGKGLLYDLASKFPCFIFDPKAPEETRGLNRTELVSSLDITSTILDYAGLEEMPHMVGTSLKPLLYDEATPENWRQGLALESLYLGRDGPIQDGYVTADGWKYIRYYKAAEGGYEASLDTTGKAPVFEQLFDLHADPGETKNVIEDKANAERLEKLRKNCEDSVEDLLEQFDRYAEKYF